MANLNILIPDELHKELKLSSLEQDLSLKDHIIDRLRTYTRKHG